MGSAGERPTVTGKVTRAKADWNYHSPAAWGAIGKGTNTGRTESKSYSHQSVKVGSGCQKTTHP